MRNLLRICLNAIAVRLWISLSFARGDRSQQQAGRESEIAVSAKSERE